MRRSLSMLWVAVLVLAGRAGAQEPYLVKDIVPGSQSSFISDLTDVDGKLFFLAYDSTGAGLWTSDGSSAGTVVVKRFFSVYPGSTSVVSSGGHARFFFVADDGVSGYELWVSDGTDVGTVLVKDIWSGTLSSRPWQFVTVGDTLFFRTDFSDDGFQGDLWKTDGTETGTVLLKPSVFPESGVAFGGALIFADGLGNLWRSDGTPDGTVVLKGCQQIDSCSLDDPWWTISNGRLYFAADDGIHGSELWRTDGTPNGTVLVRDLEPGSAGSSPSFLTDVGGTLFFAALRGGLWGLWRSDGTAKGTRLVRSMYVSDIVSLDGRVLFTSWKPSGGLELWRSDGTAAGTVEVHGFQGGIWDVKVVRVSGRSVAHLCADDGTTGPELWRSNGTTAALVKDITPPGASGGPFGGMTRSGNYLFFLDNDGTTGWELWALPLQRPIPPLGPSLLER